jgi:hypothetical protein
MRTKRIHQVIVVSLVAAVGAATSTAAATGPSSARANEAWQGTITIHTKGKLFGSAGVRGTFTLSVVRSRRGSRWRVIADRGTFVQRDLARGLGPRIGRVLVGAKGTIRMRVLSRRRWEITEGSRAYAGLRGRGTEFSHWELMNFSSMMKGTVWR